MGSISAKRHRYQGFREYPALLAAGAAPAPPGRSIHAREIRSGLLFWPSRKRAAPRPARCSLRAFSIIWITAASRRAIWSGRPTTASSSRATYPRLPATASMCASRRPPTPTRVMSKLCIVSKKASSLIWKTSPAAAKSSPECIPTCCTSTSPGPTPTLGTCRVVEVWAVGHGRQVGRDDLPGRAESCKLHGHESWNLHTCAKSLLTL